MGVLVREFGVLYQAFVQGKPSPLAPVPLQYADFAHWQRQWLEGEELLRQRNYWQSRLAGAPPLLQLPTDRPRPAKQSYNGDTAAFSVPRPVADRLTELTREGEASLFMTLLSAYAILLSRYSGQEDFVVGTTIANRTRVALEDVIGFFINQLALRHDLSGNPTFRELLAKTRTVALEAYANQDLPFDKLVESLKLKRNLSYNPLFQVVFVLQNFPRQKLALPELSVEPHEVEEGTTKYDLMLFMVETERGLTGHWVYNTDLFETATVAGLSRNLVTLLSGIAANPDSRIDALEMVSEADKQQRALKEQELEKTRLRSLKRARRKARTSSQD
jgi:non-ribosomal peptide synthetase component F